MGLLKAVMGIFIEIYRYIILKSSLQLTPEIFNKPGYPTVVLVILLAVADEDVVIISFNDAGHLIINGVLPNIGYNNTIYKNNSFCLDGIRQNFGKFNYIVNTIEKVRYLASPS